MPFLEGGIAAQGDAWAPEIGATLPCLPVPWGRFQTLSCLLFWLLLQHVPCYSFSGAGLWPKGGGGPSVTLTLLPLLSRHLHLLWKPQRHPGTPSFHRRNVPKLQGRGTASRDEAPG